MRHLIYNLLLWLLFPLLVFHFFRGRLSQKKYNRPLSERFGMFRLLKRQPNRFTILIHAVSVGETVASQPFVDAIIKRFPDVEIIFSTVTETGHQRALDIIPADYHIFFPLDYKSCVSRFLDTVDPQYIFILETEIWPNFLSQCHERNIPVNFVNGRISDKSFERYSNFRWFLKPLLQHPQFYMQTKLDLERILKLGSSSAELSGNLKYDQLLFNLESPTRLTMQSLFQDIDPPVIVYGSMHQKETSWILQMIRELHNQGRRIRHIIAPRHLNFLTDYSEQAKALGLKVSYRSKFSGEDFDIMFLDTYGELANLYEGATICVVGGSFEDIGGHSILEPALFYKPILYGPFIQNFREITQHFETQGASSKVQNIEELRQKLEVFLDNESLRLKIGQQAGSLVRTLTGATNKILERVAPQIDSFKHNRESLTG